MWRVIQAEGRKLSLRWSFRNKLAKKLIARQGRLQRDMNWVKVLRDGENVHSGKARDGPSHVGKSAKGHRKRG